MSGAGSFAGWALADKGCHWIRTLPDTRAVYMTTWGWGVTSGYSLTVDLERRLFPGLDEANAAFDFLANAVAGTPLDDAPGAVPIPGTDRHPEVLTGHPIGSGYYQSRASRGWATPDSQVLEPPL